MFNLSLLPLTLCVKLLCDEPPAAGLALTRPVLVTKGVAPLNLEAEAVGVFCKLLKLVGVEGGGAVVVVAAPLYADILFAGAKRPYNGSHVK